MEKGEEDVVLLCCVKHFLKQIYQTHHNNKRFRTNPGTAYSTLVKPERFSIFMLS